MSFICHESIAQALSRKHCQHYPMEENTEVNGFAQGHVARGKSGSWTHAPSTTSWGTNLMEDLSFTGAEMVLSSSGPVALRLRLVCSHGELCHDCQGAM